MRGDAGAVNLFQIYPDRSQRLSTLHHQPRLRFSPSHNCQVFFMSHEVLSLMHRFHKSMCFLSLFAAPFAILEDVWVRIRGHGAGRVSRRHCFRAIHDDTRVSLREKARRGERAILQTRNRTSTIGRCARLAVNLASPPPSSLLSSKSGPGQSACSAVTRPAWIRPALRRVGVMRSRTAHSYK